MMSGLLDELLNKDTENPDPEKEQKEGKDYIQYGSDFAAFIGEDKK